MVANIRFFSENGALIPVKTEKQNKKKNPATMRAGFFFWF